MGFLETPQYSVTETVSDAADLTLINSWDGKAATVMDFEIDGTPFSIGEGLE